MGSVTVIGPPTCSCAVNTGSTDCEECSTLPKRTAAKRMGCPLLAVGGGHELLGEHLGRSHRFGGVDSLLPGGDQFNVKIVLIVSTIPWCVPRSLVLTASKGLYYTKSIFPMVAA
jgi:hypothetical protein